MTSSFDRLHPELPVFGASTHHDRFVVYTPGHVTSVSADDVHALRHRWQQSAPQSVPDRIERLATELAKNAESAQRRYQNLAHAEFAPECLTLYLSNHCNLGCTYCYAAEPDGTRRGTTSPNGAALLPVIQERAPLPVLSEESIRSAADVVARCCRQSGRPFQLVVHGGGEPTLHPGLLKSAVAITQAAASEHGLTWSGYLATHGVMDATLVEWIARNFQRIGVSCDGPPDIHDRQRPLRHGGAATGTYAAVAQTIRQLVAHGADVSLRTTLRPDSVQRQAEIVTFFHEEFGPLDIGLEPVYDPHGLRGDAFQPDDAPRFVSHFRAAQRIAEALGCRLELSGVRLDEIHGPYCNVLRNVLQLTPDGTASACFLSTDGRSLRDEPFVVGASATDGSFVVEAERIGEIRTRALDLPPRCRNCVNIYHCARDCPDVCPVVEPDPVRRETPGFRCRVQKQLAESWIRELGNQVGDVAAPPLRVDRDDHAVLAQALAELPGDVDADAIVRQWQKAATARLLPQPPWVAHGYNRTGSAAWDAVRQAASLSTDAPMAVYVHLPFCDRKCAFCDCYAIYLSPDEREHERPLVEAVLREIDAWATVPALTRRPISTIHFGGGTANYLSAPQFERIVTALRSRLHVTDATEWAVETTTSQLSPAHMTELWDAGFRRLHVGVQTLDDRLRQLIGRRESAGVVLAKLQEALRRGFVTSIDLIYGLPGLTLDRFARDLEILAALGIDGCSLYQLNASPRNRAFIAEHQLEERRPVADFVAFHLGEQLLRARGFRKNHLAHFARPRDRNLYYTHPARGEDLLAIGPTADGSFGDCSYRHPTLVPYIQHTSREHPAFEGALQESAVPQTIHSLSTALMTAHVVAEPMREIGAAPLLESWLDREWIEPCDDARELYGLTASGSWSVVTMLSQLTELAREGGHRRIVASGV